MIQFDKTQEIRNKNAPRYAFGRGVFFQHCIGDTWARVTQGGNHLHFEECEEIEYEGTLIAEYLKSRSIKQ